MTNINHQYGLLLGIFIGILIIVFIVGSCGGGFLLYKEYQKRIVQEKELQDLVENQQKALKDSQKQINEIKDITNKVAINTEQKISNIQQGIKKENSNIQSINYDAIPLKSVVRLVCFEDIVHPSTSVVVMGSGVILDNNGAVVTNAHVVNYDSKSVCFVAIQDDLKNAENAKYTADVISLNNNLDEAVLQIRPQYIDDIVKNSSVMKYKGTNILCKDEDVKIGDKLIVVGYPTVGGYSMTVTEGIVSGFDGDYIKTSAKIEHGNSGGAAFHYSGCWLGIPSAANVGEVESLGLILKAQKL